MGKPDCLEDEPFAYVPSKEGRVFLYYQGKLVRTLNGDKANRFLAEIEDAGDTEVQLLMAKITGNFKRENEKQSAKRSR